MITFHSGEDQQKGKGLFFLNEVQIELSHFSKDLTVQQTGT
jgi:hypothetical protein